MYGCAHRLSNFSIADFIVTKANTVESIKETTKSFLHWSERVVHRGAFGDAYPAST